jgi:hypothetical protein
LKEFKDLTGKIFGKFKVIERDYSRKDRRYWWCQCSCENKTIKSISSSELLKKGGTVSCGCFKIGNAIEKFKKYNPDDDISNFKNDAKMSDVFPSYKRLYTIYTGMRVRCSNEKAINYKDYGGRGIKVCDEWLNDFMCFYSWAIGSGYSDKLSIDRKDNDGNYEPDNCQWETMKVQSNNQRDKESIIKIIHFGEVKELYKIQRETGINSATLYKRYKKGLRDFELIKPIDKKYSHKK